MLQCNHCYSYIYDTINSFVPVLSDESIQLLVPEYYRFILQLLIRGNALRIKRTLVPLVNQDDRITVFLLNNMDALKHVQEIAYLLEHDYIMRHLYTPLLSCLVELFASIQSVHAQHSTPSPVQGVDHCPSQVTSDPCDRTEQNRLPSTEKELEKEQSHNPQSEWTEIRLQ